MVSTKTASWLPALGSLRENKFPFFCEYASGLAGVVKLPFPGNIYIVQDAAVAKDILSKVNKQFNKNHFINKQMIRVFGNSLITLDGAAWEESRSLMQPFFSRESIAGYGHVIDSCLDKFIAQLKTQAAANERIVLKPQVEALTLDIISSIFFHQSMHEKTKRMHQLMQAGEKILSNSVVMSVPSWFPLPATQKLNGIITEIENICRELIAASNTADTPLLFQLQQQFKEDPQRVIHEVKGLLVAGHYTNSDLLSWSILLSEQYHEQFLNADETTGIRRFLEEVMRQYPPVWGIWYQPVSNYVYENIQIPKGSKVMINIYGLHHSRLWAKPHEFHAANAQMERKDKPGFIPFGAGQRKCLGANLAMLIAEKAMARFLHHFQVIESSDNCLQPLARITLSPAPHAWVRLSYKD